MIKGTFWDNTPFIKIAVGWGRSVQAPLVVLDTGFTGDLQVTSKIAEDLGLEVSGVTRTQFANGEVGEIPVALAYAAMEGMVETIEVLIADSIPLVGISFLTKFSYKAILDCKNREIFLERI